MTWSVVLCLGAFALVCPSLFIAEGMQMDVLASLVIAPVLLAARKRPFAAVGLAALASPFLGPVAAASNPLSSVVLILWAIGCAWIGSPRKLRRIAAVVVLLVAMPMLVEMAGWMNERFDSMLFLHAVWLAAVRWLMPVIARGVAALRPAPRAIVSAVAGGIGGALIVGTSLWIDGYAQIAAAFRAASLSSSGRVLAINRPQALGVDTGALAGVVYGPKLWRDWYLSDSGGQDMRIDRAWIDTGSQAAPGYVNGLTAEYTDGAAPLESVRARLGEYDAIVVVMQHGGRLTGRPVGRIQPAAAPAAAAAAIVFTPPGAPGTARVIVLSSAACRSDEWSARLTLDMQIEGEVGTQNFPAAALFRHALDRGRQMYGSDAGPLGGLMSLSDLAGRRVLDVGYVPLDADLAVPIDAVQFGFYDPANGERWAARGADGATFEANAVRIPVRGACEPAGAKNAGGQRP